MTQFAILYDDRFTVPNAWNAEQAHGRIIVTASHTKNLTLPADLHRSQLATIAWVVRSALIRVPSEIANPRRSAFRVKKGIRVNPRFVETPDRKSASIRVPF
jgi:hypothetical protein